MRYSLQFVRKDSRKGNGTIYSLCMFADPMDPMHKLLLSPTNLVFELTIQKNFDPQTSFNSWDNLNAYKRILN